METNQVQTPMPDPHLDEGINSVDEPVIPAHSGEKITIPSPSYPGWEKVPVTLWGSDNEQVIAPDGTFYRPLVPTTVKVVYELIKDGETYHSTRDVVMEIENSRCPDRGQNPAPPVIPSLQEWHGGEGWFRLADNTCLIADDRAKATAGKISDMMQVMLKRSLPVSGASVRDGDIVFVLDESLASELGGEGYYLTIDERITVTAPTEKGLLYGGISVTQMLYMSDDHASAPRGEARDYPKYEVRSVFMDAGRFFLPLPFLEKMGKYLSWFKINEFVLHLNDDNGRTTGQGMGYFRMETDTYPEINESCVQDCAPRHEGYYGKDAYRRFQKTLAQYGVDVISELDTPAHAAGFYAARTAEGGTGKLPFWGDNWHYMDIRTPETRAQVLHFVEKLFDEYLDGEDPVFINGKVHIGTDEYAIAMPDQDTFGPQVAEYIRGLAAYLQTKKNVEDIRLWNSYGGIAQYEKGDPPAGYDPAYGQLTMYQWATHHSYPQDSYAAGYRIINAEGSYLYLIPGYGGAEAEGIDHNRWSQAHFAWLYDHYAPHVYRWWRTTAANPQTRGCMSCMWNDFAASDSGGYTVHDLFDRVNDQVYIMAERGWFGEKRPESRPARAFRTLVDTLGAFAPLANPGLNAPTTRADGCIVDYRPADDLIGADGTVRDRSGNGYDGLVAHAVPAADPAGICLSGEGSFGIPGLPLGIGAIGYPYTVKMCVRTPDVWSANTVIGRGEDVILYANYEGTGHMVIDEGQNGSHYRFEFTGDYVIPAGTNVELAWTCSQSAAALYLNGRKLAEATAVWNETERPVHPHSATFPFPTEEILKGSGAVLGSFTVYNRVFTEEEIRGTTGES